MPNNRKINIAILFGGRSAEHEVSLRSAKNIVQVLDKEKYNLILIGIDKEGKWYLDETGELLRNKDPKLFELNTSGKSVTFVPQNNQKILSLSGSMIHQSVDVVFPVLHGPYGEDGTIQGLLKLANIPFVGSGVLGSAIGMDKEVMKRLLREAGIPEAKFLVFKDYEEINFEEVVERLNLPFFVKPANLGSSVGVCKVKSKQDFDRALKNAFKYDRKILVEEFVEGREIECSVLGNDSPTASLSGEIVVKTEFYSYETKYLDDHGAELKIPADLPEKTTKQIQALAIKTFKTLCCEGLGRVDFFLKKNGEILVNEINTMPGFTSVSMYPQLWEASGIGYGELIDRLIELAFDKFEKEQKLKNPIYNRRPPR